MCCYLNLWQSPVQGCGQNGRPDRAAEPLKEPLKRRGGPGDSHLARSTHHVTSTLRLGYSLARLRPRRACLRFTEHFKSCHASETNSNRLLSFTEGSTGTSPGENRRVTVIENLRLFSLSYQISTRFSSLLGDIRVVFPITSYKSLFRAR